MTQNMFNQHAINCGALLIDKLDKLVMNPGLSYARLTTSDIKYRAEHHVIPTHDPFKMSASTPPVMAGDHSTLGDELILQISLNIFCC